LKATRKSYPREKEIRNWVNAAANNQNKRNIKKSEISIRIVDEKESAEFNKQYRDKNVPTNILSFPAEIPEFMNIDICYDLLGYLLICAPVLTQEALQQNKRIEDHWAHIVIHGVLHLFDYDHTNEKDARIMEQLEVEILNNLGISNPYLN